MRMVLLLALAFLTAGCARTPKGYSVPELTQKLQDADPGMRSHYARELGHLGPKAREAVPALTKLLRDPDSGVRQSAAWALADLGPNAEEARPALAEALKDPDTQVRDAASYALLRTRKAP